ncbi:hypothetical protein LUZ61_012784 [Rhynchospora tenuis]|uniref:F-box domain-containing protein n=1 Tax=Rhynchospora tenuis TaxID=198213 RepID=A0AAD6A3S2_9POAL|nr:hypothetical protein LUZ61_012784 [Rhynchospora tenuis]
MGKGEDRISNLPIEILHFILCLMPLKYAIRTSTLSKRWRHLWQINLISATTLQFGEDFSCNQSPKQFVTTLDRYLQLHGDRNLHKFGILFSPFDVFFPNFEKWVHTVVEKGVKELEIDLSQGILDNMDGRMSFVINNSLFNGNSLTNLILSRCNFSDPLDSANFVGLTSLSLDHVNLTDEILTNILDNCVSLEIVCLKRCYRLNMVKFVGDKLKLRKLVMVDFSVQDMEISAPHLESFVNHSSLPFGDGFYNVSNINDAYICSDGWAAGYYEPFETTLAQLSHIKVLTISSVCVATLLWEGTTSEGYPLELSNLQELQLVFDHLDDEPIFYLFTFFSVCPSPFLEKLFIKLTNNFEKDDTFLMTDEPDVVFENLSWIKITNFGGSPSELKMVKFLLKKAVMLESIFIVLIDQCDISNNSSSLKIIQGQLAVIPKASKDARIVICGPLDSDRTINPTHTTLYYQEKYRKGTTVHLNEHIFSLLDDQDFL